ncbi:MAG: pyrimidine 5'-nucleotidase [Desulfuromonadales bacterium]|nr:pyrimidine 5'-nucleotidase [Desulfuromonadales bacterium]
MDIILFDLDNTLYPPKRQLFSLIDVRINRYMREVVGIPSHEVDGLRRSYWEQYGVTLQGLIRHYDVDPEDYLIYVHDVDISSCLSPDPHLRRELMNLSQRRVVFTNGSICHANRVLSTLGIDDLFEEIFDIRIAAYQPKPFPEPYLAVLDVLGAAAGSCIMVEDSRKNLDTAKQLGMGTILVGDGETPEFVDSHIPEVSQINRVLQTWDAA